MFDVQGKIALVTGGASGIGLSFVEHLLKNGLKHVVIADIDEEIGTKTVNSLNSEYGSQKVQFIKTDVSDKQLFKSTFEKTIEIYKNLDIVINNAGICDEIHWEKTVANGTINGTILAIEEYLPKYKSGESAVIVNVASIAALSPFKAAPIYAATKHAVMGLSRSFGNNFHYQQSNVRVLTICPGVVKTNLFINANLKYKDAIKEDFKYCPKQEVDCLGQALVNIIESGQNGSIWVVEGGEPAYEIKIPLRQQLKRK